MKKILILILFLILSCNNNQICTINENNAGKGIYDLDEATCFIALKLNKKNNSDLKLIREALIVEEKYMKKVGLISENPNSDNNNPSIELDINKLTEFALNNEKVKLDKSDLLKIYGTETEYLEFIGIVH